MNIAKKVRKKMKRNEKNSSEKQYRSLAVNLHHRMQQKKNPMKTQS